MGGGGEEGLVSKTIRIKGVQIQSGSKYILRVYCVPGTILGPGATVVNKKDANPVPKMMRSMMRDD